jgi:hypothetical protein
MHVFCIRAWLQPCRKRRKLNVGFSPRGKPFDNLPPNLFSSAAPSSTRNPHGGRQEFQPPQKTAIKILKLRVRDEVAPKSSPSNLIEAWYFG